MPATSQRILVVASESAASDELHDAVRSFAIDPGARVRFVSPGREPLEAIADALATFPATELVVATPPRSDLAERVLGRFGLPTVPVVVRPQLVAA